MSDRLARDLDAVVASIGDDWALLAGKRIFMTGGTGFIGRWMLESLAEADLRRRLGVSIDVLTRNASAFAAKVPHLAQWPGLTLVDGDVLSLSPNGQVYEMVIHAATEASADLNEHDPLKMFDTVVTGTRRALDFAVAAKTGRFLFLSSGAVYGAQPWEVDGVDEEYRGGPDLSSHRSAYAESKRAAEMLCAIHARQFGLDVVTARIFALLGPLLSLDIHFAAGNFIRDALAGRKITVSGAGTAVRSYLYAADLVVWLWKILIRANPGSVYNVGSREAVSIAELAERTANLLGTKGFEILGQPDAGWNPGRYVPATRRIEQELGVAMTVGLDESIRQTARWNGWNDGQD